MSGTSSKEERRNLRKEMGTVAAAAVLELHGTVRTVTLEHRVLARQMATFETTVAAVRQGRAADQARVQNQGARIDELVEQLESLGFKVRYAGVNGDAAYKAIGERGDWLRPIGDEVTRLQADVARLRWWTEQRAKLSRWQRFWSFVTGRCAVRLEQYDEEQELLQHPSLVPKGPVVYESKNGGPLERVGAAAANGDPLPWRSAHQGAREQ